MDGGRHRDSVANMGFVISIVSRGFRSDCNRGADGPVSCEVPAVYLRQNACKKLSRRRMCDGWRPRRCVQPRACSWLHAAVASA